MADLPLTGAMLTEGALGTRLMQAGFSPDPRVALAAHAFHEDARRTLTGYWRQYIAIAEEYGLPMFITTPTRRVNMLRTRDAAFIRENAVMARETARGHANVYVGGMAGCAGDAYTGDNCLDEDASLRLHAWEASLFAHTDVDFAYLALMPAVAEAVGAARAFRDAGLPAVVSFTLRENGCLPDGASLDDAITRVDEAAPALFYMANCIHPARLARALAAPCNRTERVALRFQGMQANASPLPPESLDGAAEVRGSPPEELARQMCALPLRVMGGCCGTDDRHIRAVAARLTRRAKGCIVEKNG